MIVSVVNGRAGFETSKTARLQLLVHGPPRPAIKKVRPPVGLNRLCLDQIDAIELGSWLRDGMDRHHARSRSLLVAGFNMFLFKYIAWP